MLKIYDWIAGNKKVAINNLYPPKDGNCQCGSSEAKVCL
jgi:hypothetical protein